MNTLNKYIEQKIKITELDKAKIELLYPDKPQEIINDHELENNIH